MKALTGKAYPVVKGRKTLLHLVYSLISFVLIYQLLFTTVHCSVLLYKCCNHLYSRKLITVLSLNMDPKPVTKSHFPAVKGQKGGPVVEAELSVARIDIRVGKIVEVKPVSWHFN